MKKLFLFPALVLTLLSGNTKAQTITTFAGGTMVMYGGDGGAATAAFLNYPSGIATDASGNVYIADKYNNRVRMMASTGVITTFAGTGSLTYGGDGGAATSAGVLHPDGVATDATGNVYISDGDHRIRKVSVSGIITTVAGNSTPGYTGDGSPATGATLNTPAGITLDAAGNMYIADMNNHCVRKINTSGIISTVAGSGTSGFSGDGGPATTATLNSPTGVAVDPAGNLYVADKDNNRIRMINTAGNITTILGDGTSGSYGDGGPATAAQISRPVSVYYYSGNIYVTDDNTNTIRAIDPSKIITTVAGGFGSGFTGDGGPATAAAMSEPKGIAFNSGGDMYITDSRNKRIRKVNTSGVINTEAGTIHLGDGGPATATIINASDVCTDPFGNVYVTDFTNNLVRKIDAAGIITTIAGKFSSGFSGDGGPATDAQFHYPSGIASDATGNLYVADAGNKRIRKISTSGIITTVAGGAPSLSYYTGDGGPATDASIGVHFITVDLSGNIYFTDPGIAYPIVRKIDASGIITTFAGQTTWGYSGDGGPATNAMMRSVQDITTDAAGNLYISDLGNHVIRKVDVTGTITTFAGNGTIGYTGDGGPATAATFDAGQHLAVDASGNLLISDVNDYVIRAVNTAGTINTIAGTGTFGYTGDGGPATAAQLFFNRAVATDAAGNIYVAQDGNGAIRKITSIPPTLKAENKFISNMLLRPNPACNEFNLSAQNNINNVMMIDAMGRIVLNNNYSSKTVKVNIANLKSGFYSVIINNAEVKKLIKE